MNKDELGTVIIKASYSCPTCKKLLIEKKIEPYKRFYLCKNKDCFIVSIIMTTTIK